MIVAPMHPLNAAFSEDSAVCKFRFLTKSAEDGGFSFLLTVLNIKIQHTVADDKIKCDFKPIDLYTELH